MCEHCGMAYSFFFETQYHKADCPSVVAVNSRINEPNGGDVFQGVNYRRGGANVFKAWKAYRDSNPNGPISVASFTAGYNAALGTE